MDEQITQNEPGIVVKCVNDQLMYGGEYISKENSLIGRNKYPRQNTNFLNKIMFIPYKIEADQILYRRLYIPKNKYPEFDGISGPYQNYTKVLRFDREEPYVAILIDEQYNFLVCDSRELLNYYIYPGYVYSSYTFAPGYTIHEALNDSRMVDWPTFNEAYKKERFWCCHIQDQTLVGKPVYIEYFSELYVSNPRRAMKRTRYNFPDSRIYENMLNVPMRTDNTTGYIICADAGGEGAHFIVCTNHSTKRFLLDTEAFFFYRTDYQNKNIKDLYLWEYGITATT